MMMVSIISLPNAADVFNPLSQSHFFSRLTTLLLYRCLSIRVHFSARTPPRFPSSFFSIFCVTKSICILIFELIASSNAIYLVRCFILRYIEYNHYYIILYDLFSLTLLFNIRPRCLSIYDRLKNMFV